MITGEEVTSGGTENVYSKGDERYGNGEMARGEVESKDKGIGPFKDKSKDLGEVFVR